MRSGPLFVSTSCRTVPARASVALQLCRLLRTGERAELPLRSKIAVGVLLSSSRPVGIRWTGTARPIFRRKNAAARRRGGCIGQLYRRWRARDEHHPYRRATDRRLLFRSLGRSARKRRRQDDGGGVRCSIRRGLGRYGYLRMQTRNIGVDDAGRGRAPSRPRRNARPPQSDEREWTPSSPDQRHEQAPRRPRQRHERTSPRTRQ